jgi:predicted polyphosphate/ATP-dependent NAD kinase
VTRVIGFLVNPIAGMGGAVGLKGTDGQVPEALRRGAVPVAPKRAQEFLRALGDLDIEFLTCSGPMGEDVLKESGIDRYTVISRVEAETTAADTVRSCRLMRDAGCEAIVFCGGDGTARDVFDAVGTAVPIIGIPAGVKMYSAVFATSPRTAAELVRRLDTLPIEDREVMDVDEEAYRRGKLATTLYGYARVPSLPAKVQISKFVTAGIDENKAQKDIARFIVEIMRDDTLYILGAGTTTHEIGERLGLRTTLLGVDGIQNGKVVGYDLNEREILALLETHPRTKIIVSPIGAQGFVLGRGNQQISARVLKTAGAKNLIVVATPQKMERTPTLYFDIGDDGVAEELGDSVLVISGYRMGQRHPLVKA